jgi:hypothetical protein
MSLGTMDVDRAFSRISLWARDILSNSKMDICVGVLFNCSRTLYPSRLGLCLGGALDDGGKGLAIVTFPPCTVTPHSTLGPLMVTTKTTSSRKNMTFAS